MLAGKEGSRTNLRGEAWRDGPVFIGFAAPMASVIKIWEAHSDGSVLSSLSKALPEPVLSMAAVVELNLTSQVKQTEKIALKRRELSARAAFFSWTHSFNPYSFF